MTPELKEYLAFISYQRKDEETARWLHHQLEHYQVPISIIESQPELMKLSRKVFLDSVELSSGILSEEIDRALNMSRFLIVICSPNSAQSLWVDKEIRRFLTLNGPDSVIPFIITGAPYSENRDEECFAPALIELRNTSAEILGINISEYGREVASVKVMAYMLGLKFDSLWQRYEREKEQEYRRMEEERNRLLRLQSLFLAEKSLAELSDGNLANARYLALKALPRNVDHPDRPIVEEAESALRKAMNSRTMCMRYSARINSAIFNQDSKMIIAGGEYRTLTWRRIPDGALITSIPKMSRILKVRSSSDCSLLIVSTYKGNVLIYGKDGELIKTFKNHGTPICDAVLSHDNSRLYVATAKGRLYVYNFVSGILLYKIEAHEGKITSLALSSSDTSLASASLDGKVKVWKTAIMEQACCYDVGISQVGFNPMDDTLLISSANGSIRILDILNNEIKWENTVSEKYVSSIAFSDDGKEIAYGSKYGVLCILDAETGKTQKIIKCHDDMITSVAFNTSCSLLLTASADKTVKVHQLKDPSLPELKRFDFAASTLSVNADKTIAAAISQNGIPILFNLATHNYDKLNVGDVRFSNLCLGHNTPLLAALSKESTPRLWLLNTSTMNVSHTINLNSEYGAWINNEETSDSFVEKPKDAVSILSFSPDDKLIAILIGEKAIGLYSVTNCRLIRKLSGFKSNIKRFVFSPSGDSIAVSDMKGNVHFVETDTGVERNTISVSKATINTMAYDETGDYVALGVCDKTIVVYNLRTNTIVMDIDVPKIPQALAFLYGKDYLVAGDSDLTIYEVITGKVKDKFSISNGQITRIILDNIKASIYFSTSAYYVGHLYYPNTRALQTIIDEASTLLSSFHLNSEDKKRFYLI